MESARQSSSRASGGRDRLAGRGWAGGPASAVLAIAVLLAFWLVLVTHG